jgi:hypothetical protein
LRQQGRIQARIQFGASRIVSDRNGRQYKIEPGTQTRGKLSAKYDFSYDEEDGLVTNYNGIKVVNYLVVQNLRIPLIENDRLIQVQSESESLIDRLFGDFFF